MRITTVSLSPEGARARLFYSMKYMNTETPGGAFRQASPLDEADAARWRSLPKWFQERWDAFAALLPERSI